MKQHSELTGIAFEEEKIRDLAHLKQLLGRERQKAKEAKDRGYGKLTGKQSSPFFPTFASHLTFTDIVKHTISLQNSCRAGH